MRGWATKGIKTGQFLRIGCRTNGYSGKDEREVLLIVRVIIAVTAARRSCVGEGNLIAVKGYTGKNLRTVGRVYVLGRKTGLWRTLAVLTVRIYRFSYSTTGCTHHTFPFGRIRVGEFRRLQSAAATDRLQMPGRRGAPAVWLA